MDNTIKDAKVKDEVTQAREKFLDDMQKPGFPINIQGRKALEQRRQNEGSWASKPKEQDKPMKAETHMTDVVTDRPDEKRLVLLRSIFEPSTLDEVAEAVAVATEHESHIYVERVAAKYRWSLTHSGGGYPLLRITSRFLHVDKTRIMVGCREVDDGVCILCRDINEPLLADRWAVIEFDGPTSPEVAREHIINVLGDGS